MKEHTLAKSNTNAVIVFSFTEKCYFVRHESQHFKNLYTKFSNAFQMEKHAHWRESILM